MRCGPWHQLGDRSQKLVQELLESSVGVGAIISPRDLGFDRAQDYSRSYHALGAHVLIDQQFYVPEYSNEKLTSYPTNDYRTSVARLSQISDRDLDQLADSLQLIHHSLSADGLLAPAVVYEAGRPDVLKLNARLFTAAQRAGQTLGIPTYATVMLGSSVTKSEDTVNGVLSAATALDADGWYFGFEFGQERIPTSKDLVFRCCAAGLTLACTGKPVLHAYAGPMALLSSAFGAVGAAVGQWQNLWQFTRGRWESPGTQGGGGGAPPRYFSGTLWGTIVHPDETAQLSPELRDRILTPSPYDEATRATPLRPWTRWDSMKHLVHVICSTAGQTSGESGPRACAERARSVLQRACHLHADLVTHGIVLRDASSAYQGNWGLALADLLDNRRDDFAYLELLSEQAE